MTKELELLKECPFCGCKAELRTYYDFYRYSCPDEKCQGYAYGGNPTTDCCWYGSVREAATAWNTRVERTCHVVIEDECPVCSECQEDIDPSWAACPYCGAEIINE